MVPRVSRVLMSLALFGVITVVGSQPTATASNATLHIEAPAQGRVGEAIGITLTLESAPRVAGYEAFASFDRTIEEFGGVFAGGEDAAQVDVETAVAGDIEDGAAFA